jgi:NAD(P)-dependent dehydrogenase (short-subunit alcohol dehydrogenase family)
MSRISAALPASEADPGMPAPLHDKVAIVTSASRNIGRAIAHALAADGGSVVVNARTSRAEAERVVEEIVGAGGTAMVAMADVTNPSAVDALFRATLERFGRLDILVNNAATRREAPIEAISFEDWREVVSSILDAAFLCAQAAAAAIRPARGHDHQYRRFERSHRRGQARPRGERQGGARGPDQGARVELAPTGRAPFDSGLSGPRSSSASARPWPA